jgi:hypothetical protein
MRRFTWRRGVLPSLALLRGVISEEEADLPAREMGNEEISDREHQGEVLLRQQRHRR